MLELVVGLIAQSSNFRKVAIAAGHGLRGSATLLKSAVSARASCSSIVSV